MSKEKEQRITELVEGDAVFESRGISRVKVTKDGKAQALVFPIRSTGVAELIDTYTKRAPRPPVVNVLVDPKSQAGRELGLGRKQHVKMPDLSDQSYIQEKEKYDQELGLAIVLQGLDVPIKDRDGKVVENKEQKVEILKGLGMTGDQFMQIAADIQDLTRWEEEKQEDFFD